MKSVKAPSKRSIAKKQGADDSKPTKSSRPAKAAKAAKAAKPAKAGKPKVVRMNLSQLARKLQLSTTTVSFVLNGLADEKKIPERTSQRVFAAAKKYNYLPNPFARSMLKQRSHMIGVILGNLKMDYAEHVMLGMRRVLKDTEFLPLVSTHGFDGNMNRRELLASFARRDEGVIAFPVENCEQAYRQIAGSGAHLLMFGEILPGMEEYSSIVWDSAAAAKAAVKHLVEIGRRKIAFLGVEYAGIGNTQRYAAYCDVIAEYGLPFKQEWVVTPTPTLESDVICEIASQQFFATAKVNRPDAVFVINDGLALPFMVNLRKRGLRVPEDVAIIGLQDLPLSGLPGVSLSTVREPVRTMAEEATQVLLDLIEGRIVGPIHRVVSNSKVIVRESTVKS